MQCDKDGIEIDQGIFFANVLARSGSRHAFLPRDAAAARRGARARCPNCRPKARSISAPRRSSGEARPRSCSCATRASSTPRTTRPCSRPRPRSISRCSIRRPSSRAARRHGRQSEICRQARVLDRHQSHASLSRHDPLHVVRDARDGLREQVDARPRARRTPARTRCSAARSRSRGSRASRHFAIGGGCQYLLTMDYVVAASDAYMTLPARKEGIIPGAANMRMPRFIGDRIARQAIMVGRRLDCDTPEGRMICDEIVPPGEMDAALDARDRELHRLRAWSARPATGAHSALPRSRSTRSAATWRSMRASRPIAISARR